MGTLKISERRGYCIFMVVFVLFLGYTWIDTRTDWNQKLQETVNDLRAQGKTQMAERFNEAGPDSFIFRFHLRKPYLIRAIFAAMIIHILMIKFGTYIPNQVLAYRYCVVTAKILPVVIILVFLSAWLPWVDTQYEAEVLSLETGAGSTLELRLDVAIARAYRSLVHCIWIGWWTYVLATWMLTVSGLSQISRLLLPGSTVKMFSEKGKVY